MNFTGKTAVVTGGSRGIGRAICLELARGGANVMLCYAGNEQAALDTAAACEALGAKAAAMRCAVAGAFTKPMSPSERRMPARRGPRSAMPGVNAT